MTVLPRKASAVSASSTVGFHWMKRLSCSTSVAVPSTSTTATVIDVHGLEAAAGAQRCANITTVQVSISAAVAQ